MSQFGKGASNANDIFADPRSSGRVSTETDNHGRRRGDNPGGRYRERRNNCFSSSPWWLKRNYLDQD